MADFTDQILGSRKAQGAIEIIKTLHESGFEAYLAGGSVRDLILGRKPKDFDIATSARPEQIDNLFTQIIPVGREFGIVIVKSGRYHYEVATFRGERGYSDRRRPDQVYWTSAAEDAQRRDFTINALFYDPINRRIIDYVNGTRDVAAQLIRFVGDPEARVKEDPLRILRAIRFKNALAFQYDSASYQAIRQHAADIQQISAERIRDELNLMWKDRTRANALHELADVGLLKYILPEIDRLRGLPQPIEFHREGDTFDHTLRSLAALPAHAPTFLVWAVLLHDAGKFETIAYPDKTSPRIRYYGHAEKSGQLVRQVGHRLKMPRVEMETIAWLVSHHMSLKELPQMREAKKRLYLLDPRFRWLLELHRADAAGTLPCDLTLYQEVKQFYQTYLEAWKAEQKTGAPKPLLSGYDLQKIFGLKPGPKLGQILEKLRGAQLERQITTKSQALALVKTLLKN